MPGPPGFAQPLMPAARSALLFLFNKAFLYALEPCFSWGLLRDPELQQSIAKGDALTMARHGQGCYSESPLGLPSAVPSWRGALWLVWTPHPPKDGCH